MYYDYYINIHSGATLCIIYLHKAINVLKTYHFLGFMVCLYLMSIKRKQCYYSFIKYYFILIRLRGESRSPESASANCHGFYSKRPNFGRYSVLHGE